MTSHKSVGEDEPTMEDDDAFVYVFDRRESDKPEVKIPTGGLFSFVEFKKRVQAALNISPSTKFIIATTDREEIRSDDTWDIIDKGDTLYVLNDLHQELCAPAQERVNFLPHYDTIVKGGMYEYYASEGQNPLPYAFAELIDNSLAATANNIGHRKIEIRLYLDDGNPKNCGIYVIDNGKGMTPRQLNNWAIYRLSKFIRKDQRGKVIVDGSTSEDSIYQPDAPRSLNSDISYFGVGGKQAVFFIGNSTRMITRPRGSQDVHELTISKEEFEMKEKNHEAIYSGFIRNRKPGDISHLPVEDELLVKLVEEETGRDSFTMVAIQGINADHVTYLKQRLKDWTRQLAHIYHFYIHGPNGNVKPDESSGRIPSPFKNIDIQIKMYSKGQTHPKVIDLRDVDDDMQTLYVRNSASTFEFKALVEGSMKVEGILRYHPFMYDRETYPSDMHDPRIIADPEDDHGYAISETPARGRRPIFECYWNGRLIPYTLIEDFEWCSSPKKMKTLPIECYNRISGVLWTDDKFQVSTNKLTFIDLEMKLRDKQTTYSRIINGQEKRTSIEKEFSNWLKECHEQLDKQIHFSGFQGKITRSDLPKHRQFPWCVYKQVEWDARVFKDGQLVRIMRTLPILHGTINRILLFGDYDGDVYATGGDLEITQEPRSLYAEVKIVPLSKLDRLASPQLIKKYIEEEEAKLPDKLVITWPDGFEVTQNEKRPAGKTIGDMKVEIVNKKGEKISKLPGTAAVSKKLLVELKVIWHAGGPGDQVIVSHISQHGKNWPYWFRKMENIKNMGNYTLQLQVVLNESGGNTYAGKELPSHKIKFSVTEAEPEKFTIGLLEGPFRVGVPFNIPLDLHDEFNNPTKPTNKLKPTIEGSGLDLQFIGLQFKGNTLVMKDVVAKGTIPSSAGKNFNITVKMPGLPEESQSMKIRLLPGPPAELYVEPEDEITIENGTPVSFKVQLRDIAGNVTSVDGKQSVVCKLSGAQSLPSYSMDCSSGGTGILTGDPIFLKKIKEGQIITAKIDLQGYRNVKSVERRVKVNPSGRISDLVLSYQKAGKTVPVELNQEIQMPAGDTLEGFNMKLIDEAGRIVEIDDKLANKIKINWASKPPKDILLKGQLPGVRASTLTQEIKYCHINVVDCNVDFSFLVKAIAGEPNTMKCQCMGNNTIGVGQYLASSIQVQIKDKFANDIEDMEKINAADLEVKGDNLIEKDVSITKTKGGLFIINNVKFSDGKLGRRELQVSWKDLKDYVKLEMVVGPASQLAVIDYDPEQVIMVYNENKLPSPLVVQLFDALDNPVKEADVKIQITKDPKIKFIPTPGPVKTNKEGKADFGIFTVTALRGTYEFQPKAFRSNGVIAGPKLKIMVQPDPTRPSEMKVEYDNKAAFVVGEKMPDVTVKVFAEDEQLLATAKPGHISMKLWKSESGSQDTMPSKTVSFTPDAAKKQTPGTFIFRDKKLPEEAGSHNIMFVYYDGKHQVFSNVIHIAVDPATPTEIFPIQQPGTPTVSNTRNIASRCVLRNLQLQLRDRYGNHVTKGMNGSVQVEILSHDHTPEIPKFVGNNTSLNLTLAGGVCNLQNLTLQESCPGVDGQEYILRCTVICNNIPKTKAVPPYEISFLFYNEGL
ncbi:hypothetical protein ACJMK2_004548 [Sinanodonta woodiana]|uniref:Structural maintenance of chromosomes flexible hinge domain-containing protein 1 n=1 Tax=Sinanodonta woodiana TaxID=1069815 RepID=A0ABD3Y239_SINWO